MALDPNFPKTPKYANAVATVATTSMDGSGSITELLTAGDEGSLITDLKAIPLGTITATVARLYIKKLGDGNYSLLDMKLMAAYTLSQTVVPVSQVFVDKCTPDGALRLPAGAKLGVSIGVAQAAGVGFNAEYMDY